MTQNTELEKVKARIKALTEKTVNAGCTDAEAQAAMSKVGELLDVYGLTMEEIDVRQEKFVTITIQTNFSKRRADDYSVDLAHLCSCKIWTSSKHVVVNHKLVKFITYNFFGHESDTLLVKYLFETIESALNTELRRFKNQHSDRQARGDKKVLFNNFKRGFIHQIAERLRQRKKELDYSLQHARSTGTSLVLLKEKLVEAEYEPLARRMGLRTVRYYHSRQYNAVGRLAGSAAGEKVNLSRPIEGAGRNQLMLK